jgi:hypothetical protein
MNLFGSLALRGPEVREPRFLQFHDEEPRKEAGIIRAEVAHIFSLRATMLASTTFFDVRQKPSSTYSLSQSLNMTHSAKVKSRTVPRIIHPPSLYFGSPIMALTTP